MFMQSSHSYRISAEMDEQWRDFLEPEYERMSVMLMAYDLLKKIRMNRIRTQIQYFYGNCARQITPQICYITSVQHDG